MSVPNTTQANISFPLSVGPSKPVARYLASEAQLEVWLSSQQSDGASCAYNEISSLTFNGNLDTTLLEKAIRQVIQRHDSLRTTASDNGQEMVVHQSVDFSLNVEDFSGFDADQQRVELDRVVDEEGRRPFDLSRGPFFRARLQKLSDDQHKLTITGHHLAVDGWSWNVLCRDIGYFYDTGLGVRRDDLPPAIQYRQYADGMEEYFASPAAVKDEEFWLGQYADSVPILELPVSGNRPSVRTYAAGRCDFHLNPSLVARIRSIGGKAGCSLFNVMLASFSAYMSRITGNDDFSIGIPTAGQASMNQLELIGHCVNTMPLRTKVDVNENFLALVKSNRNELLNAIEHSRYSFGTLLRKLAPPRDPSRPPLINVLFNLDPVEDPEKFGFDGLQVRLEVEPRLFENFEWSINGIVNPDKSVDLLMQYNRDLFTPAAIKFYLEGFESFLQGIADDPLTPVKNLNLMSIPQRQQMIVDWNASQLEYPVDSTLHAEFSRQAASTPDAVAVEFDGQQLTYRQVETQSNQIARYLQQQRVVPGDLVGICVNRSERMLVYLYAILKAGVGYVPLDPAYPIDRLQYMCDHSGLKLVVTENELVQRVTEFDKPVVAIDDLADTIKQLESTPVQADTTPADVCYVIYTSGSTGKPKGVQVPHGAVVNFLYSMRQEPGFGGPGESLLAVTTLSFDIAVLELYLPTIFGGRVVVADSVTAADGKRLAAALVEHDIDLLQATPATWRLLIQSQWAGKQDLKVLCGGEPMPRDLVQPLLDRCGQLWNMYGPTETTVWSAAFQVTSATDPILIGKPIGNTQIYILDANGNEVPVGCEGEVFIGGAGVTLGYRNREDLTDQRFVPNRYRNPFVDYVSDRLYKTGDLAKYRFDGNIEFLRRNDKQVKVRGFRIELGEIETAIKSLSSIQQCVAVVREDTVGDARLVAYAIAKPDHQFTAAEVKDHVRQSLPYYMVPQHIVQLDEMPSTNNGKIDYKALPAPQEDAAEDDHPIAAPQTSTEKYLAQVWSEVLDVDDISVNDLFFDIGGHSLLVMQVISQVETKTGVRLAPQDFLTSTLEQIADKLTIEDEANDKLQPGDDVSEDDSTNQSDTESARSAGDRQQKLNGREQSPGSDVAGQAKNQQQSQPPNKKMFRKLTGFWNE